MTMTKTSAHVARRLANMFKDLGYHVTNVSRDVLDSKCKKGATPLPVMTAGCPYYFYVDNRPMIDDDEAQFAMASVYVFTETLDVRFEPWSGGGGYASARRHREFARELEKLYLSL